MTARHREPPPADHARYRTLLVALIALFIIGFFILRVLGVGGDGDAEATSSTTTTTPGDGTGSSLDDGSATTVPGDDGTTGSTTPGDSNLAPLQEVNLDLVYDGFQQPVVIAAPSDDDRIFVVQRVGVIRILDANRMLLDTPFLDLRDQVISDGIERGMLGLAFHPDYANNGRFFVYYIDKGGKRQLSEFRVSPTDPNIAFASSEKVLFEYDQPEGYTDIRHYAGNVIFGPDGYLWVSMGDGADSRDQGQDPNTPYGTIVRIDVDTGDPYSIPADNPFANGGGMPEVWAYGMRNPWRFSIDPVDSLVYIGDVGHDKYEEINVVAMSPGGNNFGWSDMEGPRCFHLQDCDAADYTSPVLTYVHEAEEGDEDAVTGYSVTGGIVYRGTEIPELAGIYFYSDWVSRWIRSFKFVDGQVTEEKDWSADLGDVGSVTTFGLDGHGELYLATYEGGLYKFTAVR